MALITIRDPIHGTIEVSAAERLVIDSRAVQRLRNIRQLGFAELAYPGATHSRYAHSLGAMHVAGRMSQVILGGRSRFVQYARLAALLHDVGHAPLSHASEHLMPDVSTLALPRWATHAGQATHEDYTVLLLLQSELTSLIDAEFGAGTATAVASLIVGSYEGNSPFMDGGVDYFPVLRQLVSSEIDADRMDYLLRDSFYTGVNYGKYELDWLYQHGTLHVHEGRAYLAIGNRAIFAFEDFLLSRLHMFLAVYYHYVPVGYDHLMLRYAHEADGDYTFPSDAEGYLERDDIHFVHALRTSKHPLAQRLAHKRGYRLVLETTERDQPVRKAALVQSLKDKGIDCFETTSAGRLSKYFEGGPVFPIFVKNETLGQTTPLERYTPLFERYRQSVFVSRVYCEPDRIDEARRLFTKELRAP